MKKPLYLFVLTLVLLSCQKDQPAPATVSPIPTYPTGSSTAHLRLGNPTAATANSDSTDNFLLIKDQYVVSYSRTLGRANWVSWHLQKSDLGPTDRQNDFRPDNTLPVDWYRVKPTDYASVDGFDRGHLCPSGDRTNSQTDNSATFLMTNIMPQAPTLNRGVWQELESYCRELVEAGSELYILAGGYGNGATGSQGYKTMLASGRVKVPAQCWKIILVLPEGDDDLNRVNAQSTVIAVDMLNAQSVRNGWEDYIVPVSALEKATRYSFFTNLPASVQAALKIKRYIITPVSTPPTPITAVTPPVTVTPPATATTTPPATVTVVTPPTTVTVVTPPTTVTITPPTTATLTPPITVTVTPPTTTTTTPPATTEPGDTKCGIYNGKQLYRGPKGGCYYINGNGNKTYVDRALCTC